MNKDQRERRMDWEAERNRRQSADLVATYCVGALVLVASVVLVVVACSLAGAQ
jgi:hypothetical protein